MRSKNPSTPLRKKPFILLEVLIALSLFGIELFFLLKILGGVESIERKRVQEAFLRLKAKESFWEFKESLFEQRWGYETLKSMKSGVLDDVRVHSKTFSRWYEIEQIKSKKALLLKWTLHMEANNLKKSYSTYFVVQSNA